MRRNLRGYGYFDYQYNVLVFQHQIVVFPIEALTLWYCSTTYLYFSTNRSYLKPYPNSGTKFWYPLYIILVWNQHFGDVIGIYNMSAVCFDLVSNQLVKANALGKTFFFKIILMIFQWKTDQSKSQIDDDLVVLDFIYKR